MMENWERVFTDFIGAIKMAKIYELEQQAKTIAQQQEIIDRQRNALQLLLNAIWIHVNSGGSDEQLQDAYRLVTSASTMTGTTEE